jgi:phosphoribosyl 1,2-cyclic phosphodiesterase
MKISLLASGSKGNATLIDSGATRLLVDAGLSARELTRRLDTIGVESDSLDALLITHEHSDHVRGLGPLVRRHNLPVYLHTTLAGSLKDVGRIDCVREFSDGEDFTIGDLSVSPFTISHDALAPVGFTFANDWGKTGLATDLGIVTRLVRQYLAGCRSLVIETNHDEEMLRDGPYPWALKQRVRSAHGHLSNPAGRDLLRELLWEGLETVFLGHLSETNNRPALAVQAVNAMLADQTVCRPQLLLGRQDRPVGQGP